MPMPLLIGLPTPRTFLALALGFGWALAGTTLPKQAFATNSGPTLAATVSPAVLVDLAGTSVSLDATVTGAEPGTYQVAWLLNNSTVSGATSQVLTLQSLKNLTNTGSYAATVSTSSSQAVSAAANVAIGSGYTFMTLAGVGGGSVDGTLAMALFETPSAVAADASGNLYVADTANNTIRKVAAAGGLVTTLAGSAGHSGSSDGTGNAARFNSPSGITVDSSGNVYVADTGNDTVRMITPMGVVTTLAGSPGVGGGSDGTGSSANFSSPVGLAIDSLGNIYVADSGNNTIRKLASGGVVTTLAGTAGAVGSTDGKVAGATFNSPSAVAVDSSGNIYIADTGNDTIRKIVASTGMVTTLAGTAGSPGHLDAMGTAASFNSPSGIAVDNFSHVFVADSGNDTIRELTLTTGAVATLWGVAGQPGSGNGGGASMAELNAPLGIALCTAGLYIADSANNTIRLAATVSPGMYTQGILATAAGAPSTGYKDGPVGQALFQSPTGLAVDGSGNIYVADSGESAIRMITAGSVATLAGGVSVGSADGTGAAASFNAPNALAVDGSGNVYVADTGNDTIRKIAPGGLTTTLAGIAGTPGSADGIALQASFNAPLGVAVDSSGNVYVADSGNGTVRKITPAGVVSTVAGTAGVFGYLDEAGPAAQFDELEGITTDTSGNIYVVEGTGTVRVITPTGTVSTLAGTYLGLGDTDGAADYSQFYFPQGISTDTQGNVYVSNTGHNTIRMISTTGAVSTLAGIAGVRGGVDGQGVGALFLGPSQLAFDTTGNLYVADTPNHTIRKGAPPTGLPAITTEPTNQTVKAGGNATFSASASGTPAPTLQWYMNGVPISGATSATFTITGAQSSNAGTYQVTATNTAGVAASVAVTLAVLNGTAPLIGSSPESQTVAPGSNATFTVVSSGTSPLNGSPIVGATSSSYTITDATQSSAGSYSVTVSNTAGSVTSQAAMLTVASVATGPRLVNLSARASVGTGSNVLIAGFNIAGSGEKSVLVRGVGPTLASLGVSGYLVEPAIDLFNSTSTLISSNMGWSNSAALSAAFVAAGAFPFLTNSSDSALQLDLAAGTSYTAEVSGSNGGTGIALAEVYDTDPNVLASPTRLTNISARANVNTGAGLLIAGFVIGGTGNETVLIRAVGPTLSQFGLTGVLQHPVLTLFDSKGNLITSDQGWQSPVAVPTGTWAGVVSPMDATHATFGAASAFDLPNGTADSAIVVTLPVGSYTAQVVDVAGATGIALVEVYEVPQ